MLRNYYTITYNYDGIRKENGQFQCSKFTKSIFNKSQELITLRSASKITKDMELGSYDCQLVYVPDEAKYLCFMRRIR
jgi:hypothetical protein